MISKELQDPGKRKLTIEEIIAEAKQKKIDALKVRSPLPDHIAGIVTLLNAGLAWKPILKWLDSNGVKTHAGTPISRSYLQDWCAKHVPVYDAQVGTTDAVKAERTVILRGLSPHVRKLEAMREAEANGTTFIPATKGKKVPTTTGNQQTQTAPVSGNAARVPDTAPQTQTPTKAPAAPASKVEAQKLEGIPDLPEGASEEEKLAIAQFTADNIEAIEAAKNAKMSTGFVMPPTKQRK